MKKREIGNGWKEVTGEDGKIFYVNKKLRKRQWDWPEDVPQEDEMEFPAPPDDDELPGPPEDGDMPPPPGSSRRLGLANIAKETAATTVTAEDLDAAKRRLMGGKKKDAFGKVNVRKLIDEDVDGDWDYVFKDFATTAFDSKVSGGFFGSHKVKMEDLLKHTTKHMGQGLLKRSNETSESKEEASQMHKNILSYMGDRKSGKDKMGHTQKILKYALDKLNDDDEEGSSKRRSEKDTKSTTEFPGLWDEIYCQLVKQTTSNAKTESLMSGFELFTLCAGTFKCTQSLYPYIMSHLDRAKRGDLEMPSGTAQNEEKRIKKLARRAQIRLRKTCLMPQRTHVPTVMEVRAVVNALPIMVRVYKLDRSYVTLPVNTHTTIDVLTKMMSLTCKCQDDTIYGIYEYDSDGDRKYLAPKTRVMDVVSDWQREAESEDSKDAIRKGDHSAFFMFEVHYFLDEVPEDDVVANQMLYIQAHDNVRTMKYPLSRKGCLDLGAIQLQEEFGDYEEKKHKSIIKNSLHRYLPPNLIDDPTDYDECADNLLSRWEKLQGLNFEEFDCQLTYLDLLKPSIWYGCQRFRVKSIAGSGEYPSGGVWLNISSRHILVVDCDSNDILETILMSNIMAFGSKDTTLLFKVGNIVYQEKKCFITDIRGGADEITDLIRTYQRQSRRTMETDSK